jgi:membrane protease subunit (stomatin/prohibitin family)
MFRRRRPLLRAAVVGGGAYVAGKHMARKQDDQYAAEADQNQRISDLESQQQPAPAAPAAAPASSATIDQLKQLSELHQQGVLTDAEFAAAKAKLLGT